MTGFLCALGGVCLQPTAKGTGVGAPLQQQGQQSGSHSGTVTGSGSGYSSMSSLNTVTSNLSDSAACRRGLGPPRGQAQIEPDWGNVIT